MCKQTAQTGSGTTPLCHADVEATPAGQPTHVNQAAGQKVCCQADYQPNPQRCQVPCAKGALRSQDWCQVCNNTSEGPPADTAAAAVPQQGTLCPVC